jgi:hypothetical protein
MKAYGSGQSQSFVYRGTRSHLGRARPRAKQWSRTSPCLARGSLQTVSAPSTPPKTSLVLQATLAKSPYQPTVLHAHLMSGSSDTLSWHAHLRRQGRSDRSHFALSLTDLTGKQRRPPYSGCCANHPGETDNGRVQPRAQQEAPPRLTPGLGLGRKSPPRLTPGLSLGLGRKSPPRPTPGLGLGKNHVLARPWVSAPASASEESSPRPTSDSDQPRHEGCIIVILLASSGYEGTRPASHQVYPGNRRWWFPACNHDVGGPQASYGSKETSARSMQRQQLYCYRVQGTSPTTTTLPLQDSRRPPDGHVDICTGLRALPCQPC